MKLHHIDTIRIAAILIVLLVIARLEYIDQQAKKSRQHPTVEVSGTPMSAATKIKHVDPYRR